jgi:integrase
VKNRAAIIEPRTIGKLLRTLEGYDGEPATSFALRFSPYVFERPGELRGARWDEFDWEAREWRIPPERMKMREQHVVPLSRQAIALLEGLRPITEYTGFLFPSLRSPDRPMSNNTVNAALRRLG